MGVPLAWRNLTADPRRLLMSMMGIGFATLLMLMQLGFRNSLVDSQVELVRKLDCDAIVISRSKYQLNRIEPFPRRRLFQALAADDVVSATPLYLALPEALWKNPSDRTRHRIRVVGIDPEVPIFNSPDLAAQQQKLTIPDTVLTDARCRGHVGRATEGEITELTKRRIKIAGEFLLGTDFYVDGTVVTSDRTFFNLFPDYRAYDTKLSRVEMGLLRLRPDAYPEKQIARLNSILPADVTVLSRDGFINLERDYWMRNSPVGLVFNLGTIVGFIVGVVICSQILFTEVSEKRPQFATLKAIGYSNSYLRSVVLTQACLMALMGFLPGLLASWLTYQLIAELTGLLMRLSPQLALTVLGLTIGMCLVSGLSAVKQVLEMDPASTLR